MGIFEFKGEYRFLSNFYNVEFVWDNIVWKNSEAAYQAAKSEDRRVRLAFSKLSNPVEAKRSGKHIDLREDWEEVKYSIMKDIVYCKFSQNKFLKDKLIATGDLTLEEGNTWGDTIWGICPPRSGNGKNWLGKILMEIRRDFTNKYDV